MKAGISEALGHSVGSKFLRVVALGALLVGAVALYSSMSQGEAGSRPASSAAIQDIEVEELEAPVIGIAANGSSEGTQAFPDTSYYQDAEWRKYELEKGEAAEALLVELRQAFIGIPLTAK